MKKLLHKGLPFILFVIVSANIFAQTARTSYLPNIVSPSPDAAALGKYGQIPTDKSTGIPEISIPLYEVKTPRFSLPISLSYHASGIKVDETASWVGLGWSLNAGGVVTRTIVDLPDNGSMATLPATASIQYPRDSAFLQNVMNRVVDAEPDDFFYNFNGMSGSFVFGTDGKAVITPYKPLQISFPGWSTSFQIVDEVGNKYYFNDVETVGADVFNGSGISSWYLSQMISADNSDTMKFVYSADPSSLINYSYNFSQAIGGGFSGVDPTNGEGGSCYFTDQLGVVTKTSSLATNTAIHLSAIYFKNGRIEFKNKPGNRLDNAIVALDSIIVSNLDYKTGGLVRTKSFKIQTDYFTTSINNTDGMGNGSQLKNRLRLVGVSECDNQGLVIKRHAFDYSSIPMPPLNNFGQDKWGYYNGQYGNTSLLQFQTIPANTGGSVFTVGNYTGGSAPASLSDRTVHPEFTQAGMLQKIHYPTGGITEFVYEPNQFMNYYNAVVQYSASGVGVYQETQTTTFTAPDNTNAYFTASIRHVGDLTGVPSLPYVKLSDVTAGTVSYQQTAQTSTDISYSQTLMLVSGHQYQLYGEAKGNSSATAVLKVYYTKATQDSAVVLGPGLRINSIIHYDGPSHEASRQTFKYGIGESGCGTLLSGTFAFYPELVKKNYFQMIKPTSFCGDLRCVYSKTIYTSNSSFPLSTFQGSPIAYPMVTAYEGSTSTNAGKTISEFNVVTDVGVAGNFAYSLIPKPVPYSWKNGQLTRERTYRNDGSGTYTLVKEKDNSYMVVDKPYGRGLKVGLSNEPAPSTCPPIYHSYDFYYFDYPITSGNCLLTKSVDISFDLNSGIALQDSTRYYYDNTSNDYLTRQVRFTSKGDVVEKKMKYPQDMVSTGSDPTGIYASMTQRNIISPVIETTETQNGTIPLTVLRSNYANTAAGFPAIQSIETKTGYALSEKRATYNSYDNANNLQNVSLFNDVKTSYLWGYGTAYPVAKVINADNTLFNYYVQASQSNSVTVPKNFNQNAYTSFQTYYTGSVTLALSFVNGAPSSNAVGRIGYTLTGPQTFAGDLCICNGASSLCSGYPTNITFSNVPVGNYTLNIVTNTNSNTTAGVSVVLNCSSQGRQLQSSGIREFYYQGFEDQPLSTSTVAYCGDRSKASPFQIPYVMPTAKSYVVDYFYYNGTKWTYVKKSFTNNMTLADGTYIDEVRVYPNDAQMTTYTYRPLFGVTSENDAAGKALFYEYDNFQRLKNIKDYQGNIVKNYLYNYATPTPTPILVMKNFLGVPTKSYPVGVFDVNGKLIGNATTQSQYISLWNSVSSTVGTLSAGIDSMHFILTLNANQTSPGFVTGCRYYQYDFNGTSFNWLTSANGCYVDFGDGAQVRIGDSFQDSAHVKVYDAGNHTFVGYHTQSADFSNADLISFSHTYSYSNPVSTTVTVYHNDDDRDPGFELFQSLGSAFTNVRGIFPAMMTHYWPGWFGAASAQIMTNVTNWNGITTVRVFTDGSKAAYLPDFMKNNLQLEDVELTDTMTMWRLKSNWNKYFINLKRLSFRTNCYKYDDLTALKNLSDFNMDSGTPTSLQVDNIINQIAAGAGKTVLNGSIRIAIGSPRSNISDASVALLKSKGWTIYITNSYQ